MMQLDSPKLQKSIEEFWYRNRKTAFHEITEHNGFKSPFHRVISPPSPARHWITAWLWRRPIFSSSCTAAWDILLLGQPIERFATTSSSTSDLSFLGAISMSQVSARGLREGLMDIAGSWEVWIWIWRWPGVQTLGITERVYMVSDGNFVNIWKSNG